ncbi:MAG: GNAT family N-acetyltransferase [Anaerolineae bacterium]|nr:GNAT family N-acetyltransferase [Anaerolineae bacterium]
MEPCIVITVRLATLADTSAITEIHKSDVQRWERVSADGSLLPTPYEALSLYERWQHGGPWMTIEMCAVHLHRLLAGAGIPLVAEVDGEVLAEAEVYENFEAQPYGHYLDLSIIVTRSDHQREGLGTALVNYIVDMARLMKCERVTVTNALARDFYLAHHFRHTRTVRGIRFPSQQGHVIYQATQLVDTSYDQIKGWHMPLGRYLSSRQEWDRMFPQQWAAGVPELMNIAAAQVKLSVAGQNALIAVRDSDEVDSQLGDGRLVCWSAKTLTGPLLSAIRDWAFRNGYQQLVSLVIDSDLALLPSDVQLTEYSQEFFELAI